VRLTWVAGGKLEAGGDRSRNSLPKLLDERGIRSEFRVMKSGHDWIPSYQNRTPSIFDAADLNSALVIGSRPVAHDVHSTGDLVSAAMDWLRRA
jgi:hypothetical protein